MKEKLPEYKLQIPIKQSWCTVPDFRVRYGSCNLGFVICEASKYREKKITHETTQHSLVKSER
jgi:hypothetical protein